MHDPADDPTIIDPFHTANIARQMRFNSSPLLIAQPKQLPAHDSDPPSRNESESYCRVGKINEF
jgi:hypothetical protein